VISQNAVWTASRYKYGKATNQSTGSADHAMSAVLLPEPIAPQGIGT
jgi:hypothetical protein